MLIRIGCQVIAPEHITNIEVGTDTVTVHFVSGARSVSFTGGEASLLLGCLGDSVRDPAAEAIAAAQEASEGA